LINVSLVRSTEINPQLLLKLAASLYSEIGKDRYSTGKPREYSDELILTLATLQILQNPSFRSTCAKQRLYLDKGFVSQRFTTE